MVAFAEVEGRIEAYGGTREPGQCAAAVVAGWSADGLSSVSGWVVFPAGETPPSRGFPPWIPDQLLDFVDGSPDSVAILDFQPLIAWQLSDQAKRDSWTLTMCNAGNGGKWGNHMVALQVEGGRVLPSGLSGKVEQCFGEIIGKWKTQGRARGAGRVRLNYPEPTWMGMDLETLAAQPGITLIDPIPPAASGPLLSAPPPVQPKVLVKADLVPEATGASAEKARTTIRKYKGQLVGCYQQALGARPDTAGTLTLSFQVAGGRTTSVTQKADTTGSSGLVACASARVMRWRWPEEVEDGVLTVVLDFELDETDSP